MPKYKVQWYRGGYTPVPLLQDSMHIWVGSTAENGLMYFNWHEEEYETFVTIDSNSTSDFRNKVTKILPYDEVGNLVLTPEALWYVNKETKQKQIVNINTKEKINYYTDIFIDNNEVWLLANNKLWRISSKSFPIKSLYFNDFVPVNKLNVPVSFLHSKVHKDVLYFGTLIGDGLWKYDTKADTMVYFRFRSGPEPMQTDYDMNDLIYDMEDQLWVASAYELVKFDEYSNEIKYIKPKPGLN
ncbi:MAG: hypothetical protein AAGK97_15000, partial [Bacteroidota bacterium]